MYGPPMSFDAAAAQRSRIEAERHPSPHLRLLIERYVHFWRQFSDPNHALPALQVRAPVTHQGKGTCSARQEQDPRWQQNSLDDSFGGNAWALQDGRNRGKGLKKPIAGPFPLIYVPFVHPTGDKEFVKTYEGWSDGRYSAGRPWVIDSAELPPALGDPLRCEYARVEWRFGASDRDQRTSIGRIEGHNQEDPPAVTTHRLTLHGEYGIVTHYLVTFVPPGEHEVQAREEGEVAHVLGKAAVHRRY
ncbi:hypothetical protein RTBOTA2_004203 [Rhodotorula toruloides]|nr:hypothetical protein RTBOTA2_004203 [Rhodotorula toruloides]